jgi:uroporphyrinogen-III synthase
MPGKKIKILSTRPVGESLKEKAAANNILLEERSFIKTEPIIDKKMGAQIERLSGQKITALFTSMNAVEAVGKLAPNAAWDIGCIGYATKKLVAKYFGEKSIKATGDDATRLGENLMRIQGIKKVYFFCGNQRRDELPKLLQSNGVTVHELEVYRTIQITEHIDEKYDGILFFSPSAVNSFFEKNTLPNSTALFAIGNTTARALKPFTDNDVVVADKPGKKNLVNQAIHFFTQQMNV